MKNYFITGIGTEIGKTLVSAILVEKLKADYWKPVQSGDLDNTDTDKVRKLISNPKSVFHPEIYRLSQPFSPHKSAKLDGTTLAVAEIDVPGTENTLIIEGASGLMVPLNETEVMADLIAKTGAEVILVSRNYLGSINHTLLSVELLHQRKIPVKGLVFNGLEDASSGEIIVKMSRLSVLGRIPELDIITPEVCRKLGAALTL